jgi:hypothetical protein
MNKSQAKKIQYLLTKHLLNCGSIELLCPDGVTVEIGITKDSKHGEVISDDYCFVRASRDGNATLLDTYNVGLQYAAEDKDAIIYEDSELDEKGRLVKRVDVC